MGPRIARLEAAVITALACDPCGWCRLKLTRRAPGFNDTPDARWRIDFVDDGKRRHLATRLTSPTGTSLLWVVFLFRTIN